MKYGVADYTADEAKVKVSLSNGEEAIVCVDLIQRGINFREWWEDTHPDGIGWHECFEENELDDKNAEVQNNDYWYFADETKDRSDLGYDDITIDKIIEIIYADWERDDRTISDVEYEE